MGRFNLLGLRPKSQRHPAPASPPSVLLLIGIHREELEFGRAVARGLDRAEIALLEISEGLSGQRPLPGEKFHYDTLHEALYRQLLPHMAGRHRLLVDLHSGSDSQGPSVDLISADTALCARLKAAIAQDESLAAAEIRVIPLGDAESAHARTVIPREIWDNPDFGYLGIEVYLPENGARHNEALKLTRQLVRLAGDCIDAAAGA